MQDTESNDVLSVGTELAPLVRSTGFANWNRYAAVNNEFVPIHMDNAAGQAAGMAGAFGMGNLTLSYLHTLLRNWLQDRGRIVSLSAQFRKPNFAGEIIASGAIASVSEVDGRTRIELELRVTDESGDTLAPGRAVVELV